MMWWDDYDSEDYDYEDYEDYDYDEELNEGNIEGLDNILEPEYAQPLEEVSAE
jgi:hypothetical protein